MSWVAVGVGVAGAVAGAYGASKQAGAARDASNASAAGSAEANRIQEAQLVQQRADNEPFRLGGITGLNEYMAMLGLAQPTLPNFSEEAGRQYLLEHPDVAANGAFGNTAEAAWRHYNQYGRTVGYSWGQPQSASQQQANASAAQQAAFDRFRSAPGYQFGLQEGQRAVNTSANAQGGLFSGKAGKALVRFGTDYADQQGFTPYMNRLASLSGMAQTANSANSGASQNYANQYGANAQNAANARASGIIGSANAWSNYGNQLAGYAGMAAGAYQRRSNP